MLAREAKAAREAERLDGEQRVFILNAEQVAAEVPQYGKYVAEQVARLGRNHPLVKTQYYCEEIDSQGGMFSAQRQALMQGRHSKMFSPLEDELYAILVDIAGEDEGAGGEPGIDFELANPARDSTALTVVRVDLSTLGDELIQAPTYQVVNRYLWTGIKHTHLYGQIKALAQLWNVRWLVVDATGVGAGMASFLGKALPGQVIPFVFTSKSKSDLGWSFLAVVETGRYREYQPEPEQPDLQGQFWKQVAHCQSSVDAVPGRTIRWGVPDGSRDPASGELIHDDLLISAALCAILDKQEWGLTESGLINGVDPLAGMDPVF
ncbi:MAG: hypothetical protein ACNA8H_06960 [Anaerolineales bacterium]